MQKLKYLDDDLGSIFQVNPFDAVKNLIKMLKQDGVIYGFVPFLHHYHAPNDLQFQDFFRFSKDSLAYLFKDFKDVELHKIRLVETHTIHTDYYGPHQ